MKVCRNRARVIIIFLCGLAGVVMGTDLARPLSVAIPSTSPTAKANASAASVRPVAKGKLALLACPPPTINGTLGSGSPDYPFTSGLQTGRILNGLGNINCGSSNPCSLNTASGTRTFDAYMFINPASAPACVTVAFTMSGCNLGQSIQFSARLESFDPANPCANYLADGGAGFSGLSNGSFSFNVPAGQNFVVVVNENEPAGAVGCAYTLDITGLSCQASCPPTTPINGTLGSGSPDYPATSSQQTGRIVNGLGNFNCGDSNPCSLNTATGSRAFDAYTFTNPGATTACVTVDFTMTGCSLAASMQFSARLGSFDPTNPCANYVGDAGAGFSGETTHSFSFNVPAGQNFVVVVSENDPGSAVGCAYSLTISGISCAPLCPPTTGITGTLGSGSPDYPSTTGQQAGRLSQNGVDSSCANPKTCPGVIAGNTFAFDAYQFQNTGASSACATITFQQGCGVNQAVHPVAYLGSFDPNNICTNYLGDMGHSINAGEAGSFSVNVPAGQTLTLVIHRTGTVDGCSSYHFTVTGLPGCDPSVCPGITCPASVVVPNTPGQCGAVVNYSTPTANASCGTVSCSPGSGSSFPVGTTTVNCTTTSGSSCSFTVTVNDTQNPSISCPAPVTVNNTSGQCSATVNYPAPTASDNCGVASVVCSPASGSSFAVGTTTVNCTATDTSARSASCSFTVRVNDTQPPTITCPADITAVAAATCPASSSTVVSFAAPAVSDNCQGVNVVCSPTSGASFPVGTTTVTCTATDAAGNPASCTFRVNVFNGCVQDDTNPSTVLLLNSITGDYRFCCGGTTFTGRGTVSIRGCTIALQHNTSDRRVAASLDTSAFKGSASLQAPPGTIKCSINDRDTRNNSCVCQ